MAILEIVELTRSFGGVRALAGVSMSLSAGQVSGIIGPNGAGKSTLVNVVSGLNKADAGRVVLGEREITTLPIHVRARLGVVRTFQHPHHFGPFTVDEVIRTGLYAPGPDRARPSSGEIMARFGLSEFAGVNCATLPYGTKKLVNVAYAWALQPKVLFLDEPFAGVGHEYAEQFVAAIRQLASDGVAVGLIEHNIELVMTLSDEVNVLDAGAVIFSGTPADAVTDRRVIEAFLGSQAVPAAAGVGDE